MSKWLFPLRSFVETDAADAKSTALDSEAGLKKYSISLSFEAHDQLGAIYGLIGKALSFRVVMVAVVMVVAQSSWLGRS